MKIIADCGSSKTDWALDSVQAYATTVGYNPNYGDGESFINSAQRKLADWPLQREDIEVHFYGAGQLGHEQKNTEQLLRVLCPHAQFHIESDLVGACRSVAGHEAGIVAILGTGSGSCYYDGKKIADQVPSLGFAVGDEGSGVHIGKLLLQAYAYRRMPEAFVKIVDENYPMGIEQVKKHFFGSKQQNIFLANFAAQFRENIQSPFMRSIIADSLTQFVQNHLINYSKYNHTQVHFVGSIAYHHADILKEVLEAVELSLGNIEQRPIEGLVKYHADSGK